MARVKLAVGVIQDHEDRITALEKKGKKKAAPKKGKGK